ncbi:hypothetical protein B9Z19DRAFT_122719 [Tuber borchii]|uniref:Uncharacterized protein n=1 Tax=Tuber borchii TaxID=42251 RepID=A0A2T6ZRB3_TUBBO|nr:hypothetical protein B9Z19DRAFT_122719 [Tuber borchii]
MKQSRCLLYHASIYDLSILYNMVFGRGWHCCIEMPGSWLGILPLSTFFVFCYIDPHSCTVYNILIIYLHFTFCTSILASHTHLPRFSPWL